FIHHVTLLSLYLSKGSPDFLAIRTFFPFLTSYPTRVGSPLFGSIGKTFDTRMGASWFKIPPCGLSCDGCAWIFTMFTPSTSTRSFFGSACRIVPCFPLSFPERTVTLSPFLTCINTHLLLTVTYL